MDKLESLSSTLSNITMYDIKSMYNQAKNVVLNVSEMEAKVREATNDDPWGASSTLMQEIAQGTFHFQYFNEVMPSIYSRFMEKEARQWRQIYKALQLLEYLIKHGSERVVDDARSHISTLKMLRNFHYIDDKGKDEGINVRNRSRELVELLSDVEKIRSERRKAKANKSKYIGVGNDGLGGGSMSFESSGGGRYGGFGSDSLGGGGGSSYGGYGNDHGIGGSGSSSRIGGGGGGGGGRSSFSDNNGGRRQYEEYDAGGDEVGSRTSTPARSSSVRIPARKASAPPPPPPAPAPVVDLLGGFDDDTFGAPAAAPSVNKALPAVSNTVGIDDDEFADFQAAPVQPTQGASTVKKPSLMDMLSSPAQPVGFGQPQIQHQQQQQPPAYGMGMGMGGMNMGMSNSGMGMGGMGMGMGMGGVPMGMGGQAQGHRQTPSLSAPMVPQTQSSQFGGGASMRPTNSNTTTSTAKPAAAANFDDLWSLSLGGPTTAAKPGAAGGGKSIKDLEKEKALAGLWGGAGGQQQQPRPAAAPAFGAFGNGAPQSSYGGADDLLL